MEFKIYNTLKRKIEVFKPINEGYAGLYVCGPTVYGNAHLGHARPAITFDVLFRFLKNIGYKVRYVRNITDVGHLMNDSDDGEDKVEQKAKLEQLEPMELTQIFIYRYHKNMEQLNVLPPSIEPRASGHIPEQIELLEQIIKNGFAYESNGSVYFDVIEYAKKYDYGQLSGRKIDELLQNTRTLDGQEFKRSPSDFALWKQTKPEHIMKWKSPWGEGVPGWHLECTAMATKYLGEEFDIHGGGSDLKFPHHEAELAQAVAAYGKEQVKYWMHNNMVTINSQKMGKSLGNFITLDEIFTGEHSLLEQTYSPMVVRFFILQAHYRGTLDFSNQALQAAEKGLERLLRAVERIPKLPVSNTSSVDIEKLRENFYEAMLDDLNTPILISHLFDTVRIINNLADGKETITKPDNDKLLKLMKTFVFEILGLQPIAQSGNKDREKIEGLISIMIQLRSDAKTRKDYETSDKIRNTLADMGIILKDTKEGVEWEIKS